jgi:tRNA modification GTPase
VTELIDTIAARATPPGVGAIAVVRVSGPGAFDIARAAAPRLPDPPEPRTAYLTVLVDSATGEAVDQGLLTWFPGPASFTGEDSFEFSGHGGEVAGRLVLQAVLSAGARLAEPGEFTRRAVANGRIDLIQAEALGDLIDGNGAVLHRTALRQLDRHLSDRVSRIREEILGLEAVLAHHIDFPDEDDAPVPAAEIAVRASSVSGELRALAETAPEGRRLRAGAMVVLAGRPNAGKSSLYNALLGEERALVTEIAGTTRDALEVDLTIEGFPIHLVDTAGLGDPDDLVERLGIEVAHRFLEHADLVLYCVSCERAVLDEEWAWLRTMKAPSVVVRTKADAFVGDVLQGVPVSSVSGFGLDDLRGAIVSMVFGRLRSLDDEVPVLLRSRQVEAVSRAAAEVESFAGALRGGVPAEYAATHLRAAESALEDLVGLVDSESVLDRLFSSFCIGK